MRDQQRNPDGAEARALGGRGLTGGPEVSVVMAVLDSAPTLRRTLASVLDQEDVDLELIVVNDGSSDETPSILEDHASADPRLRVVHQENRGLTAALARGCELARGRLLARQDGGGDVSLPGRLRKQTTLFERHPDAVLVSGGVRYVSPDGELLYEVELSEDDVQSGLARLDVKRIRGPAHHGTTMFRKRAYERAGGYRAVFPVAQDLDLWLRLVEAGSHRAVDEIVYQATFSPDSISASRRGLQLKTAGLILECARRRRSGREEDSILDRASNLGPSRQTASSRLARSSALYFMASCLESRSPQAARRYYRRSLAEFPLNPKPWLRLFRLPTNSQ